MHNEKFPLNPPETRQENAVSEPVETRPINVIKQQPINGQVTGLHRPKRRLNRMSFWVIGGLVLLVVAILATLICYYVQLKPLSDDKSQPVLITVEPGSTPNAIGQLLANKSIIRSSFAFDIYTRLSSTRGSLQAGTYRLSPAESTPDIVKHLVNGSVDKFSITFFPGATLTDKTDKPDSKKYDVTTALKKTGLYSDEEISAALKKTYDSPLFKDKLLNTDLEGYIYGETYNFNIGATVEDILQSTFAEFYKVVQDNKLVDSFASRGFNLYQGITLASIVQREASSSADQKQVAQVFLDRLDRGMRLGSDVTFIYAANKLGVAPVSTLESPYNTRLNVGLPPGPISTPGLSALMAVVTPASGDYVYFVAGNDGRVHFARTLEEHEANIANYCTTECNKP